MAEAEPRPRFPWLATLLVLAAVGFMVHLGFWQLDRLHQKEAMIAEYRDAMNGGEVVQAPLGEHAAYRRAQITCLPDDITEHPQPYESKPISARNLREESGWGHVVRCNYLFGDLRVGKADVVLGWSKGPAAVHWMGGAVAGVVVPGGPLKYHIFADPPLAGLQANARPDPRNLPNNHLSYAVQWFLFAATAVVIYGIALRKRLKG